MKISLMALVAGFCLVVGLPLVATAGPTPGGPSAADGDGLEDYFDNCYLAANPSQKDTDHDGCGNQCDCDFNNDGVCSGQDLSIFKASYLKGSNPPSGPPDPGYNDNCDMDGNGVVSGTDLSLFKAGYLSLPGPSGFFGTTGGGNIESQRRAWCSGPNGPPGD